MFKNILVPVDLADVAAAEPALARAVEMVSASGGKLRLIYVRSILPVTYMEFIPANFDTDQQVECERKLAELAAGVELPPERISTVVRLGSVYNEVLDDAKKT
ncbi:MAG: universal stress protein, partial [Microvirga sp.]